MVRLRKDTLTQKGVNMQIKQRLNTEQVNTTGQQTNGGVETEAGCKQKPKTWAHYFHHYGNHNEKEDLMIFIPTTFFYHNADEIVDAVLSQCML